jgi:hypothetical protein
MKVFDKRPHPKSVEIGSLYYGDCFLFPDDPECLCMVVMGDGCNDGYCCYVDFEEAVVNNTIHQTQVIPVEAETTILRNK